MGAELWNGLSSLAVTIRTLLSVQTPISNTRPHIIGMIISIVQIGGSLTVNRTSLVSSSGKLRNVYCLSAELRNNGVSETDYTVYRSQGVRRHEIYVTGLSGSSMSFAESQDGPVVAVAGGLATPLESKKSLATETSFGGLDKVSASIEPFVSPCRWLQSLVKNSGGGFRAIDKRATRTSFVLQ